MNIKKTEAIEKCKELKHYMNYVVKRCNNNQDTDNYIVYLKRFIKFIQEDKIIKELMDYFVKYDVDENDIVQKINPVTMFMKFVVHEDENYNASCILKILQNMSKLKTTHEIINILFPFYQDQSYKVIINEWNNNQVIPCFKTILRNLKKIVLNLDDGGKKMKNSGISITATDSNIIIGKNNVQNINSEDIFKELTELTNKLSDIDSNTKKEILNAIEDLRINEGKPSFKDKVSKFISITAPFTTIFINAWNALNKMTGNQ